MGGPRRRRPSSSKAGAVMLLPPAKPGDPSPQDPLEVWITWVGDAWRQSVESILLTGQRLALLRAQFKGQEWEQPIEHYLGLSKSMVAKLIAIGGHKVLNAAAVSHGKLPASWTVLYELTLLEDKTLEAKLKGGAITPKTERSEVLKMKKGDGSNPAKKKSNDPWHKLEKALDNFIRAVTRDAKDNGLSEAGYAAADTSRQEFAKRFDGLMVNLKEFKRRRS